MTQILPLQIGAVVRSRFAASARSTRDGSVVAAAHSRRDSITQRMLAVADVCALSAGLLVGTMLGPGSVDQLLWGAISLPLWLVLFAAYGLYSRDVRRINQRSLDDLPATFHALLVGSLGLSLLYRLLPTSSLDFARLLAFACTALVAIPMLRGLVRRVVLRWLGPERVLMIGERTEVSVLVRKMRAHPEYGLLPIGALAARGPQDGLELVGRGRYDELEEVISRHRVDRVLISHTTLHDETLLASVRRCRQLAVKVSVLPRLSDVMGPSVEIDDLEGITVLGINPVVLSRGSRLAKRTLDLLGAGMLLTLLSPVLAMVVLAVRLDSRGPVLFAQQRVGRGGRRFRLLKFRTMVVDAESLRARLEADSQDPNWLKLAHDPRITRVGRWLRHSSLDELPQLWNVLRGQMSLVGPRPLIEPEDRMVTGWGRGRLDLTPGLTGLWQVLGRANIPFEEMVMLDYLYVTNWSLWSDMRLLLRTLPAIVSQRGAN